MTMIGNLFIKPMLALAIGVPMATTVSIAPSQAGSKHYYNGKVVYHGHHRVDHRTKKRSRNRAIIAGAIILGGALYLHKKRKDRYVRNHSHHHHVHKRVVRKNCHYHHGYKHCHHLHR